MSYKQDSIHELKRDWWHVSSSSAVSYGYSYNHNDQKNDNICVGAHLPIFKLETDTEAGEITFVVIIQKSILGSFSLNTFMLL